MGTSSLIELEEPGVKPTATWRLSTYASERIGRVYTSAVWARAVPWSLWLIGYVFYFAVAHRVSFSVPAGGIPVAEMVLFSHLKALLLIGASQTALVLVYARLRERIDLGPGMRRVAAKVPDEGACPVRLAIRREGVVTGMDEGYLWLDGGTLFYKGLQTVFRVNAVDVLPIRAWPARQRSHVQPGNGSEFFEVPLSDGARCIDITFLDAYDDLASRRRASDFRYDLHSWLGERPAGSLETLMPPIDVHPSFEPSSPFRFEPVAGGCAMMAGAVAVLVTAPADFSMTSVASMAAIVVGASALGLLAQGGRLLYTTARTIAVRRDVPERPSSEIA